MPTLVGVFMGMAGQGVGESVPIYSVYDDFTEASDTFLGSHIADSGHAWEYYPTALGPVSTHGLSVLAASDDVQPGGSQISYDFTYLMQSSNLTTPADVLSCYMLNTQEAKDLCGVGLMVRGAGTPGTEGVGGESGDTSGIEGRFSGTVTANQRIAEIYSLSAGFRTLRATSASVTGIAGDYFTYHRGKMVDDGGSNVTFDFSTLDALLVATWTGAGSTNVGKKLVGITPAAAVGGNMPTWDNFFAGITLAEDTFTDTNGTIIASHTSDSGHAWSVASGSAQILSNELSIASAGTNILVTDLSAETVQPSRVFVRARNTAGAGFIDWGIMVRYIDTNNYILGELIVNSDTSITLRVKSMVGGSLLVRSSAAIVGTGFYATVSAGVTLEFRDNGSNAVSIACRELGDDLPTWSAAPDPGSKKVALFTSSSSTTAFFDNLEVYK